MEDKAKSGDAKPTKKRGARKVRTDVAATAVAADMTPNSSAMPMSAVGAADAMPPASETAELPPAVDSAPAGQTVITAASAAPGTAPVSARAETKLQLESTLEIKDVESTHRRLSGMLEHGQNVTVDISHVCAMDTSGAQLLLAFQNEALKRGLSVEFAGQSTAFTHALTTLGLGDAIRHAISSE